MPTGAGMIRNPNLANLCQQAQEHLQNPEPQTLLEDYHAIHAFIRLNTSDYPEAFELQEKLKTTAVHLLFQAGGPQSLVPLQGDLFSFSSNAYELLAPFYPLPIDQLLELIELFGLPFENNKLNQSLRESPDPRITSAISRQIDQLCQSLENSSQKKLFIDELKLHAAVELIVHRRDDQAKLLIRDYLRNPPWGDFFIESEILIEELDTHRCDEMPELLADALEQQKTPSPNRLALLKTYAKYRRQAGLECLMLDLGATDDDALRADYIDAIQDQFSYQNTGVDLTRSREILSQINIDSWPSLSRGYLGRSFLNVFPDLAKAKSSLANRAVIVILFAFDFHNKAQLGCLPCIFLLMLAACIPILFINYFCRIPSTGMLVQLIAAVIWSLFALIFMGLIPRDNWPKRKLKALLVFLAATGIYLLLIFGVHFLANYFPKR